MNNQIEKIKQGIWEDDFLELLQRRAMKVNEHDLIFSIRLFGNKCFQKGLQKNNNQKFTYCPCCKSTDDKGYRGKHCKFCATKLIKDPLDDIFVEEFKTILSDRDVIYLNTWASCDSHDEYNHMSEFRKGYHQAVSDIAKKLEIGEFIDDVYKRLQKKEKLKKQNKK